MRYIKMTTTYEMEFINMDGRFEVREYKTLEEAKKWREAYGNGTIYKITREKI
jgi:hypothetical protein